MGVTGGEGEVCAKAGLDGACGGDSRAVGW